MKLTNSTIAATFAALLIGGLAINPASAKVHPSHYNETGRVDMSEHVGFELNGNTTYKTGRVGPEGNTEALFHSKSPNRTNGRQG